ncbi:MAG: hypothetical protein DLM52_02740 [Chthoniobacterales bacterium]|nr:MAG: hypothetical protein DLM52_02740 [Chthoniobacterales bacterium]
MGFSNRALAQMFFATMETAPRISRPHGCDLQAQFLVGQTNLRDSSARIWPAEARRVTALQRLSKAAAGSQKPRKSGTKAVPGSTSCGGA